MKKLLALVILSAVALLGCPPKTVDSAGAFPFAPHMADMHRGTDGSL